MISTTSMLFHMFPCSQESSADGQPYLCWSFCWYYHTRVMSSIGSAAIWLVLSGVVVLLVGAWMHSCKLHMSVSNSYIRLWLLPLISTCGGNSNTSSQKRKRKKERKEGNIPQYIIMDAMIILLNHDSCMWLLISSLVSYYICVPLCTQLYNFTSLFLFWHLENYSPLMHYDLFPLVIHLLNLVLIFCELLVVYLALYWKNVGQSWSMYGHFIN